MAQFKKHFKARDWVSVGRAVAFNARGRRFNAGHGQNWIENMLTVNWWKYENKEKESGNGLLRIRLRGAVWPNLAIFNAFLVFSKPYSGNSFMPMNNFSLLPMAAKF